jgi:hypothetical protein
MTIKTVLALIGVSVLFEYCGQVAAGDGQEKTDSLYADTGMTILSRFAVPDGFTRVNASPGSFAAYLRSFGLKKAGEPVHLYDGNLKGNQSAHAAILDIDVGNEDLQQCADAVMRLRAEYLFKTRQYDKIHFNFTNGFKAEYSKWMMGYRIILKGNHAKWEHLHKGSNTYADFRAFMTMVFRYAGTLSLSQELVPVKLDAIQPGDVFIRGGSPGHAVIVMDVAENPKTHEKLFLLAQSYMPAQEIHVLRNPENTITFPWYSTKFSGDLETPEWTFTRDELKRFSGE